MVRLIKKPLLPNDPMFSEPVTVFSPVLIRADRRALTSDEPEADGVSVEQSEGGILNDGPPEGGTKECVRRRIKTGARPKCKRRGAHYYQLVKSNTPDRKNFAFSVANVAHFLGFECVGLNTFTGSGPTLLTMSHSVRCTRQWVIQ